MARSSSSSAFGLDRRLSLASITMRPRAGPVARVDGHHDVADLAGGLLLVADRLCDIALSQGDRVDRVGHGLLEGAPLRGAPLALGLDLLELLLLEPQRLHLLLELGHLTQHLLLRLVLALLGGLQDADGPGLEIGKRVGAIG